MTSGSATEPSATEPLCSTYDVALLDLDGVVYRGDDAVPGAVEAIEGARTAGMRVAYVTNNASRTPESVAELLASVGIPARADEVVTAAQAAATVLAERLHPGANVLVTGGEGLRAAVVERGLRVVTGADGRPGERPEGRADAVVQGYAPDLTYADLAEAALAVRAGALWVASNLDATIPTSRGLLPGNGALVALVAHATGRQPDAVAGKPERPLLDEAVRRTGARRPLVVGDRLDTDIEGANRAGYDSLLVLTGVTDEAALAAAPEARRPTYVGDDLRALLRAGRAAAAGR